MREISKKLAILLAMNNGLVEVVRLLLQHGATTNLNLVGELTVLHLAAMFGYDDGEDFYGLENMEVEEDVTTVKKQMILRLLEHVVELNAAEISRHWKTLRSIEHFIACFQIFGCRADGFHNLALHPSIADLGRLQGSGYISNQDCRSLSTNFFCANLMSLKTSNLLRISRENAMLGGGDSWCTHPLLLI